MPSSNTHKGWHSEESGYDVTTSPEIISQTLAMLKQKRLFLVVLHKGYQSAGTILIDHNKRHLQIDKPVDWPGTETKIRVVFKDTAKLWNHFTVTVLGVKDDLIHTSRPSKLYRLQRRAHFRVSTPSGSTVSFTHKGTTFSDLELLDISAGGIQACSNKRLALSGESETISNINIYLPPTADIAENTLAIQTGTVVRAHRNEELHSSRYGITFEYSQNEEELLLKYVRQRELEMLRSGLLTQ